MTDELELRAITVANGGERIYAEATGAGETLVLCHGLGGNHAVWWRQIQPLAEHYRVVTWDQRGFGNSTATTGRVGISEAAVDLIAVLDALQTDAAHFVGQSMGGFVALRAALDNPHRVRSLVLSTTLAGADPQYTRALRAVAPAHRHRDSHPVLSPTFSRSHPDLAVLYNLISGFGAKPEATAMLDSMAAHRFDDGELASFGPATLFMAAAYDALCPPYIMQGAAARIPGAAFTVLPDASHSAYYEHPQIWNQTVLSFCRQVGGKDTTSHPAPLGPRGIHDVHQR
jgi:3-oxoadipate enol-lactonase